MIIREVGDRVGEGIILGSIGHVYSVQEIYEEALRYYEEALWISREVSDRANEGFALISIGFIHYRQEEYSESLRYYDQALKIRREIGDRFNEAGSLNNIGASYVKSGQYEEALVVLQQAFPITRELEPDGHLHQRVQHWIKEALIGIRDNSSVTDYQQQCQAVNQTTGISLDELCPAE